MDTKEFQFKSGARTFDAASFLRSLGADPIEVKKMFMDNLEDYFNKATFNGMAVVDTSGSMSTKQLGLALGAIASYSISKEVPFVRVILCDADTYDVGYMTPYDVAGKVKVIGRGGTVLQPAITLLEKAKEN